MEPSVETILKFQDTGSDYSISIVIFEFNINHLRFNSKSTSGKLKIRRLMTIQCRNNSLNRTQRSVQRPLNIIV